MERVEFSPQARDDLARLDRPVAQRILKKIRWLVESFEQLTPEPLSGPWHGVYKLRVGDYRILYTVTQNVLTVRLIGHRREVYKTS